ncbi:MAG TPA: type II secretion system F family protein [Symbiobacteriaceae bacterium]|nr:type II secretion system F family protein [Symbiobacteriaceae bacterium]
MPAFLYRARDTGGQLIQGRIEADTELDSVTRLRNQGLLVLDIEKDRDLQAVLQQQGGFFTRKPGGKDLALFARQFSTMINAGLPVVTALKVLARQSGNKRLRHVLAQIAGDVEAGDSLATAFARQHQYLPAVLIQMTAAGEVGGILDEVFTRLADQLEKEEAIRQKVRSAMIYPAIVIGVASLILVFLILFVIPRFVEVYASFEADLPLATKLLIALSNWLQRAWWGVGLAVVGIVVGQRQLRRSEQGGLLWDRGVLKMPVFGPMVAKHSIAVFSRTLGSLLSSGITILKAMAVAERTASNRVIAAAVREAMGKVREGQHLAAPLAQAGLFPPMVIEMVSVGEETGTLEEMLEKVADFYEDEVQRTAERLSSSLEPIILVTLAITIGLMVMAMVQPIFSLWGSVS